MVAGFCEDFEYPYSILGSIIVCGHLRELYNQRQHERRVYMASRRLGYFYNKYEFTTRLSWPRAGRDVRNQLRARSTQPTAISSIKPGDHRLFFAVSCHVVSPLLKSLYSRLKRKPPLTSEPDGLTTYEGNDEMIILKQKLDRTHIVSIGVFDAFPR
jgi:hypothetical protein